MASARIPARLGPGSPAMSQFGPRSPTFPGSPGFPAGANINHAMMAAYNQNAATAGMMQPPVEPFRIMQRPTDTTGHGMKVWISTIPGEDPAKNMMAAARAMQQQQQAQRNRDAYDDDESGGGCCVIA